MKPLKQITLTLAATGIFALASGAMAGEFDLRVGSGGVSVAIDLGTPPPAPRIEVIPPPRVGYLWAPGYWAWTGHRHEWVTGRWLEARAGYRHYPGRWERRGERWFFEPEHWHPDERAAMLREHGRSDANRHREHREGRYHDHDRG